MAKTKTFPQRGDTFYVVRITDSRMVPQTQTAAPRYVAEISRVSALTSDWKEARVWKTREGAQRFLAGLAFEGTVVVAVEV